MRSPVTEPRIITVVGGTGFLGKYVVRALAGKGYRVRVVCRRPEAAIELKTCGNLGQVALMAGNLARPETIAPHLEGAYAVINLVGVLYERGAQKFSALHSQGPEKLAQAAAAAGVSALVHVSALGVDKATSSKYARSKALGEKAVRAAFPSAVILRPSVLFGPEDDFFNRFASMAALARVLPLFGGGRTRFQPVYAGDAAAAIAACMENPDAQGKLLELGGPEVLNFRQVLEFIFRTLRLKPRFIPLPFPLASLLGAACELAPRPMLTRDQVRLLHYDNVVSAGAAGFAALGIEPQAIEAVVPEYLARYRRAVRHA